jgi:hypothetical protein
MRPLYGCWFIRISNSFSLWSTCAVENPSIPNRIVPKCCCKTASTSMLRTFVKQCWDGNAAWAIFTSSVAGMHTGLVRTTSGNTWSHAVGKTGRNTSTFGRANPCPNTSMLRSVRSQVTTGASPIAKRLVGFGVQEAPLTVAHGHDELVRWHCHRQAVEFLEERRTDDGEHEPASAQTVVLLFLLFRVQFVDEMAFVSTDEISEHLAVQAGIRMSKYQPRTTVIAPLRDASVIVASGPEGYKIPAREADLVEFATHALSIIPPMLSRLSRARSDLKLTSDGTLDILGATQFAELRALVECHDQNR